MNDATTIPPRFICRGCWQVIRFHAPAILLYLLVANIILSTLYPLHQLHSHTHTGDALVHTYILNWGQHILWRAPSQYYNLPLFDPEENATALNASNPVLALLTAPYRILGNPILSYNLAMLTTALLVGLSMYAAVWNLTRHRRAAVVAAIIFSCNGDMIWHLPGHPNISSPYLLPLMILFYAKFRNTAAIKWSILACIALLGQMLSDWYLGFISAAGLLILWAADCFLRRNKITRRDLSLLAGIAVVMGIVYIASAPYREATERHGNTRGLHAAAALSADFIEYFVPPRQTERDLTFTGMVAKRFVSVSNRLENQQFFGYLPWILFCGAVASILLHRRGQNRTEQDRLLLGIAIMGLVSFILSLGPYLWIHNRLAGIPLPFLLIFKFIPPLRFLRAPARFAVLVSAAIALGVGFALSQSRLFNHPDRMRRAALFAAILLVLVVEYRPVSPPVRYPYGNEVRTAVAQLAADGIMAPIPFGDVRFLVDSAEVFPRSPSGWEGGIGNYRYDTLKLMLTDFPSDEVLARLAAMNVKTLIVYDDVNVQSARSNEHLHELHSWNGGAAFRLDYVDANAIARAQAEMEAIPDFPPMSESRTLPSSAQPLLSMPIDITADRMFLPYHMKVPPIPMGEIEAIYITLATTDPGVDFTPAEIYWITETDELYRAERKLTAYYRADNTMRTIRFDPQDHPLWNPSDILTELRVHFTAAPWPGQRIQVRQVYLQLADDRIEYARK